MDRRSDADQLMSDDNKSEPTGSDVFRMLTKQPRPNEVVDLPVTLAPDQKLPRVRLMLPRGGRVYDDARAFATEKMRELYGDKAQHPKLDPLYLEWQGRYVVHEVFRTVKKPDLATEYPRVFHSPEAVKQVLDDNELSTAWMMFSQFKTKWAPFEDGAITEEEVTAWIGKIVEGADSYPLSRMPSLDLVQLTQSIARRAYALSVVAGFLRKLSRPIFSVLPASWGIGTSFFTAGVVTSLIPGLSTSKSGESDKPVQWEPPKATGALKQDITPQGAAVMARGIGKVVAEPDE